MATAQADFRSNDRDGNGKQDYWRADIAGLYAIKPKDSPDAIKLIEVSIAGADDRPATDIAQFAQRSPKAGYWYRSVPHEGETKPDPNRFAAMTHPSEHRSGMRQTFLVSEANTLFKIDLKRTGGVGSYPADPGKAGWSKLD